MKAMSLAQTAPRVSLIAFLIVMIGCSREPFSFVPASGTITYEDGSPLPTAGGLRVIFVSTAPPMGNGVRTPQAVAYPDSTGNFSQVSSIRRGGGMAVGEYKVAVMYEGADARRIVPKDYISSKSTPLIVNTDESPFNLKVPKPR